MRTKTISIEFDSPICANCKHFYQHYVKYAPTHYVPIHLGHCAFPRLKDRMATDTCKHFQPIEETA